MNKIEQMIAELCPDGVEFKALGDIGEFENIGVDKKIVAGQKPVMLLNYMDVYRNRYITKDVLTMEVTASDSKIANCTIEEGDLFITPTSETKDDIGHASVAKETVPNAVYSYHIMRFRLNEKNLVTAFYISYLFESDALQDQIYKSATGLTRFGLTKSKFANLQIPFPPLAVQREIVNILDKFTQLEAELEARRKQYEHYRSKLLTFSNINGGRGV